MRLPIARDGIFFIKYLLSLVLAFWILTALSPLFYVPAAAAFLLLAFSLYFFRDPERIIAADPAVVLSPADGTVFEVYERDGKKTVKIFMSVFNVHVQRSPIGGKVESLTYRRGKFMHAMDARADAENEQKVTVIANSALTVEVKQIAGIIARRIVSWVDEGENLGQGQRFGMIKFGSQVDITVPSAVTVEARKGDRLTAGISIIGRVSP